MQVMGLSVIRKRLGVSGSQAGGEEGGGGSRWNGGQSSAGQVTSLRLPHIPRMTASPESLFPSGSDLDSSQLQMEPDEVDTLKEGEDPGMQGRWPSGRGGGLG